MWGPYTPMETTLLQRNVPKEQLGRVFGARSTLLTGGSPLGLAVGGILLAFAPSTIVIAFSALAWSVWVDLHHQPSEVCLFPLQTLALRPQ
jgi:hypothetical protein